MFENTGSETPNTNEQQGNANTQSTPSSSSFDTLLSEIRNERGEPKYRSVEDGLNALKHSQEYIYKMQLEKKQLEEALEAERKKAAEIEALKETVTKLTQRGSDPAQQAPQIDEEALANLVDSRLTQRQQEEQAVNNKRAVAQKLKDKFGDKAKDIFYDKASQLGLSGDDIEALAARSPKAVLTMFGLDGDAAHKQATQAPAQSRINTDHFQQRPSSFIGAETERIPLGGGETHFRRILENSKQMVEELNAQGMSIADLTDPVNYFKMMKQNKG